MEIPITKMGNNNITDGSNPIRSGYAQKMARRQHGMLYIAGLQILILILSTARESDMNKHDDFEHL